MIGPLLMSAVLLSSFQEVNVEKVTDGDTFLVSLPNLPDVFQHMSVRLNGIDAPEMKAKRKCEKSDALIAKNALERAINGQRIQLNFCGPDKYFRILCQGRTASGIDLSSFQLEARRAVLYSGGTKKKWVCFTGIKS